MKLFGQVRQSGDGLSLAPQLNQIGAAAQQLRGRFLCIVRRDVAEVDNRVEPAARQRISLRRVQSRREPFDGRSSNASDFIIRSTNPVS